MSKPIITADQIDLNDLTTKFGMSIIQPTPLIQDVTNTADSWIDSNACGGIFYGSSRIGKSAATKYLKARLSGKYPAPNQVFIVSSSTDSDLHKHHLYRRIAQALSINYRRGMREDDIRILVVRRLMMIGKSAKYPRIIMIIDEANDLSDNEFSILVDLYNELMVRDVRLSVFLFGTEELARKKKQFIDTGEMQIVNRFFLKEKKLTGINSKRALQKCMNSMDSPIAYKDGELILSRAFFPEAYAKGETFTAFGADLWDAYAELRGSYGKHDVPLNMMIIAESLLNVCMACGIRGKALYKPRKEDWKEALLASNLLTIWEKGD